MNKSALLIIPIVMFVPACFSKKKLKTDRDKARKEVFQEIDIPVAGEGIKSFFDEDLNEFTLVEGENTGQLREPNTLVERGEIHLDDPDDDFSWVQNTQEQDDFKVVYFDFDSFYLSDKQKKTLDYNIKLAKKLFKKNKNKKVTLVIDAHSCHSAGRDTYNLALSEKRGKTLKDRLVAAGIPADAIKVVARGAEMPAIIDGEIVTGNRREQWPNRRDELRLIFA